MNESMKRNGFTFWRSFRDSIAKMPEDRQLPVYRAIADYALDGTEPTDLSDFGEVIWAAILPTLQLGRERAEAGASGGRNGRGTSRNAGNKHAEINSKSIANQKQIKSYLTETETETETKTKTETDSAAPRFTRPHTMRRAVASISGDAGILSAAQMRGMTVAEYHRHFRDTSQSLPSSVHQAVVRWMQENRDAADSVTVSDALKGGRK